MLKRFVATLLLSALSLSTALAAGAQTPQAADAAGTGKKSNQPAPLPPRPLNLPKPISYKLPNGMAVTMLEDHRVPFVTFQLGIRVGDKDDPKSLEGLASLTADMLTEGTKKRTSREIAEQVDSIGAAMKGAADSDFTIVSGSALSEYTDTIFDLLADVVQNPVFPEEELKLKKTNVIQSLQVKRTDPDFLGSERFNKVVFGSHPYSIIAPTKESVEKLSREGMVDFHTTHYVPNVSTLVVVGDFQTEKMKQLIAAKFGDWKRADVPTTTVQSPPDLKGTRIYLIDRPGSVQSSVKVGNLGISKNDPDYFASIVANQVLGGSANSRLFLNIREQKGYTYGAYSGFSARKDPGEFTAGAAVRTPVTAPSLLEFLYELNRIRTLPVTNAELETAKKYLVGSFQLGFETQGGVTARLLERQLYDLPEDYLATYTDRVMAVKPEDVRRVAHRHIDYPNLVITIVGDAKAIEPDLRYFFPVEVYDTAGKLVRTEEKKTQPAS
jgi:zinc protease